MDPPSSDDEVKPAKLEEVKERGPSFHCDRCDTETVHKIAQALLPGLASACVDNTMGGLFKNPASVAVDIRREMVDYLFHRSENFVAEAVVLEGGPDAEVPDLPYDIISDFVDDFTSSKRNIFSRVSGWLLSDRREDQIDDFVQEMEINGFWLLARRDAVAQTLLKNVDFKNMYHCDRKFTSAEELLEHVSGCNFRITNCMNEGCNSRFSAAQMDYHDSVCPFKILPCEQKCSVSIMRREMDRHCITVCPMKLVNCPFYPVGCLSPIPQSTIDQHRSENLRSHLLYILKPLHRDASVEDLKKRVEQLEKLLPTGRLLSARDARSLTFAIKDAEAKLGPVEVKKVSEEGAEVNEKEKELPSLLTKKEESRELKNKKEEHLNSPTKPGESRDSSPGNSSTDEKIEVEVPCKQEEHLESPSKHTEFRDSSPGKVSVLSTEQEENRNSTDERQELNKSSLLELAKKKQEHLESPTNHIESEDSSPGKVSVSSTEQEENRNSIDERQELNKSSLLELANEKQEHLEPATKHSESEDSPPGRGSVSSSEQEDNRKSIDEKQESPKDREMPMEPHAKEDDIKSSIEREDHEESPKSGDESD